MRTIINKKFIAFKIFLGIIIIFLQRIRMRSFCKFFIEFIRKIRSI